MGNNKDGADRRDLYGHKKQRLFYISHTYPHSLTYQFFFSIPILLGLCTTWVTARGVGNNMDGADGRDLEGSKATAKITVWSTVGWTVPDIVDVIVLSIK